MRVRFISSNPHKFAEVREILARFSVEVEWVRMEYPEIQSDSLEEVAVEACLWLRGRVDEPFFVEDAGLFIEALQGFPGPYSSYVFRTIGNEGILKLMDGLSNRSAVFRSVIGLSEGGSVKTFLGETPGRISDSPRGG
ncbi:MAG: non-canonical purine NTP pyrophosphatase, partial [Thermoproteota archaeon]